MKYFALTLMLIPFLALLLFSPSNSAYAHYYYLAGLPPQKIWDYVSGGNTPKAGGQSGSAGDGAGNHYNPDSSSWIRPHLADPNENCKNIAVDLHEEHLFGDKITEWPLVLPGEGDSHNIFHDWGVWRHPSAHPYGLSSETTQHYEIRKGTYECIPVPYINAKPPHDYETVIPQDDEFRSSDITVNEKSESGASVTITTSNYHVGLNGQVSAGIPANPSGISGGGSGNAGGGTQSITTHVGKTTDVYSDPVVQQNLIAYTSIPQNWKIGIVNPSFVLSQNQTSDVELNTTTPSNGAVILSIQTITDGNQTVSSQPFVLIADDNTALFTMKNVDIDNNSTMYVYYNTTKGTVSDISVENNQIVKFSINSTTDGVLQIRLPTIVVPNTVTITQSDAGNNTSIINPTSVDTNHVYTTFSIPYSANTSSVTVSGADTSNLEQKEMLLLQNPSVVPTNPVPTNPVPTNPVPTNPVPTNPVPTNPAGLAPQLGLIVGIIIIIIVISVIGVITASRKPVSHP